mgnify:CR=1 FL=1
MDQCRLLPLLTIFKMAFQRLQIAPIVVPLVELARTVPLLEILASRAWDLLALLALGARLSTLEAHQWVHPHLHIWEVLHQIWAARQWDRMAQWDLHTWEALLHPHTWEAHHHHIWVARPVHHSTMGRWVLAVLVVLVVLSGLQVPTDPLAQVSLVNSVLGCLLVLVSLEGLQGHLVLL